jgi:hypothetical protein
VLTRHRQLEQLPRFLDTVADRFCVRPIEASLVTLPSRRVAEFFKRSVASIVSVAGGSATRLR